MIWEQNLEIAEKLQGRTPEGNHEAARPEARSQGLQEGGQEGSG